MIDVNELRITSDGKKLIVDIAIKNKPFCDCAPVEENSLYIDKIILYNQDTYREIEDPKLGLTLPAKLAECVTKTTYKDTEIIKQARWEVGKNPASVNTQFDKNLVYVYVYLKSVESEKLDCCYSAPIILVTLNVCPIYNNMMQYIKASQGACDIPKHLIDYILQYKTLELAVETEHYIEANKYFNKFFKSLSPGSSNTIKCNCYG